MRATDIIIKKRDGGTLSMEEINFIIESYSAGTVSDYQMSSLLMAIFLRGMNTTETAFLTQAMINSGKIINYKTPASSLTGTFVDKHSTGGVGDKISLILYPIVASCGVKISAMCGRGLGHTGGTIDKMDSIAGYKTLLNETEAASIISKTGYVIMAQSEDIAKADKLLYALRDVTGTVESIPLITSSILSKKVAEGSDALVFDVKCGCGAFMKNIENARALSKSLIDTVSNLGKSACAIITNMETPLGCAIGNFLEVREAIDSLNNHGPKDVMTITMALAKKMLLLGKVAKNENEAFLMAQDALASGKALEYFYNNVALQGGDVEKLKSDYKTRFAPYKKIIKASNSAYINFNAYKMGLASVSIGAGRAKKEDPIDYDAGIVLTKRTGDKVNAGDPILTLYSSDDSKFLDATNILKDAITYEDKPIKQNDLIIDEL